MKLFLSTAAVPILILSALGHSQLSWANDNSSAKAEKRDVKAEYDFSDFDEIEIQGVYELDIRQGDRFSVRTEATRTEADKLELRLEGNRLYLDSEKRNRRGMGKNNQDSAVLAIVTMPQLRDLDILGVVKGEVSAFNGGRVEIDLTGVGELTLKGRCDTLEIELSGVGSLNAEDLICEDVKASLGGIGEISVHASQRLEADAGGVGSIMVFGDPTDRNVDDGFLSKVKFD